MSKFYGAIIAGIGSCVPEKRLTNHDLMETMDTSDEWIVQRTGIRERRIAGPGETTATLAEIAARRALIDAKMDARDVELLIIATATPEMTVPSTACFVAHALGLGTTPAFDLAAACTGYLYAQDVAAQFVRNGTYKNVLVVGAETLSRIVNYKDRASCILFGDGAGATVIQQDPDPARGLIYSRLYADGGGAEMIQCKPGSRHPYTREMLDKSDQYMTLRGREVYKFAVQRFAELIDDAMRKCHLSADDIKLIIPHQVNQRVIDSAMEKLHLPPEKAFANIDRFGNTSAASIPIALDEAWRCGKFKRGDLLVFVAFGAGLTWANAVVRF